jgi:predicted murein hydrolase (TIGR00659 family)
VALVLALKATGTGYPAYFEGAQFVHFLLGPATVALAVPLYAQFDKLRRLLLPLGGALVAGSVTAIVSVLAIGWALGASDATLLSLVPKSVTAPIAMGITEKLGGIPSLTAVLVILTGISGAVMAKYVLDALRIRDFGVRGFAVGVAAHGIGTARAFQVSEEAGAFAGLGMGLNGLLTAVLVPVVVSLIRHF